MAKMTIEGVTYEGTPEELRGIVRTYETPQVSPPFAEIITDKVVAVEKRVTALEGAKPASKPLTYKRAARVGDRILITKAMSANGYYKEGDVLTVTDVRDRAVSVPDITIGIWHEEYEVIVEYAQARPETPKAPADLITHNGADYTLVDRKAQPGDVVYVTKEAEGTAIIPNDAKYLVDVNGKIEGYDVYPKLYNRTEANVLVYAPVAEEAPKQPEFPQNGDIVRVTSDRYNNGFTEGAIGVVVECDKTFSPSINVCGQRGYARVEIVAQAEDRADMR